MSSAISIATPTNIAIGTATKTPKNALKDRIMVATKVMIPVKISI